MMTRPGSSVILGITWHSLATPITYQVKKVITKLQHSSWQRNVRANSQSSPDIN